MAMRVTGRGRNGRAHLSPRSHVLTKAVGQTISASWSVTNTGEVPALGWLEIFFIAPGSGFFGVGDFIPAGATVRLSTSGVITTLVPGTTYNAEVRVRAAAPAMVAPGGVHPFTLTVSPTAGALLSANGIPTIT